MKKVVFICSLLPLIILIYRVIVNSLGPNPVMEIIHFTGLWSLNFFLITLSVSPIHKHFGFSSVIKLRRMLGLFAFFYVSLHFLSYGGLDLHFNLSEITHDLKKHPFVYIGFIAFILTTPLALTSNTYAQKILKKNWKRLHRIAYIIPVLGVIHFWWLVKRDLSQPIEYAIILTVLLSFRLNYFLSLFSERKSQWLNFQDTR